MTLFRAIILFLARLFFGLEVRGREHLQKAGERTVFAVNHQSFLDGVIVAAILPGKPVFAVSRTIAQRWWVKPWLKLIDAYLIEAANPYAMRDLIRLVQGGRQCVIFPEGRLTETGALMKIYAGPATIADKADAPILPVRIDGLQFTPVSRMQGRLRLRWFPKVTVTILPPEHLQLGELSGPARRETARRQLHDIMAEAQLKAAPVDTTVLAALVSAAKRHGLDTVVVDDIQQAGLTYRKLMIGAELLGRHLVKGHVARDKIGLLLPNMAAMPVSIFGVMRHGCVPSLLNYSAGARALLSAIETGRIRRVVTARAFIERANLESLIEGLTDKVEIVYLEDIRERISTGDRLGALIRSYLPGFWTAGHVNPLTAGTNDAAVMLFTSGSEGAPKGVVLSHRNLLANGHQMATRVGMTRNDVVFNALPLFHSFGFTGGMLFPLLFGAKCQLYPSPLHYRIVPEAAYHANATFLFGTDTFLAGYGKRADAYDFYSVRYVCAGAEKLKETTRQLWQDKFGIRIYEGYGATETAPVIAVNTPMFHEAGSVGRFLPGIEHRLEPMEGVEEGGRLWVRGPNVMAGYMLADRPGVLQPPADGWYDTGDIGVVDAQGFLTLRGRAKRFAKIAGEMVSLNAVEAAVQQLFADGDHAIIAAEDARKGEKLVLLTTQAGLTTQEVKKAMAAEGFSELWAPREMIRLDRLPVLGTGKIDYPALKDRLEGNRAAA